jgi:endonuclease/exonuclease/phosphatase family metal-dependent hydrolase
MPDLEITDTPPQSIELERLALAADLNQKIPPRRIDRNLLVGTWNIRGFGNVTKKWDSSAGDSPKRDYRSLIYITEIIRRFDVVAVQEVKDNIRGLRYVLKLLGPEWGFILTDVTLGQEGNEERMAFLFDTRRIKPSGLACELVVPPEWLNRISPDTLKTQFARTPYAVSFLSGETTVILVTLHVTWGDTPAGRVPELKGIAEWMAEWAKREKSWGHNFIVLGDFNIDRKDDPAYQAFSSTGLKPPAELDSVPRTIFQKPEEKHFYDQIAWFTAGASLPVLELRYEGKAGGYDFRQAVFHGMENVSLSWHMSDHFPLWAEFLLT